MLPFPRVLLTVLLLAAAAHAPAAPTAPDPEAWLAAEDDPVERALAVSEGDLAFLAETPDRPVHHHFNRLEIDAGALRDGWVTMHQCHDGLDAVRRAEILFRPGKVRDLQVTEARNLGRAWIEGASVQLEDVRPGARLCLRGRTRALHALGDGLFELRNGPFMRRFLDGYYPLRLSLEIRYPPELQLIDHIPESQPGFRPRLEPQRVSVETWFEGRLNTYFRFLRRH